MSNKILLVEDDQNFGDVLKSYLEMHDYDVTLASDGVMGLESYKKGSFDLCIFDVMMPRKDGFTLAKEVREKDKEMPIIFLTAKNLKEDVLEGFKIGADDYLSKPLIQKSFYYASRPSFVASIKPTIKKTMSGNTRSGNIISTIHFAS
jgi:DNA-binding response OmpR family regulator